MSLFSNKKILKVIFSDEKKWNVDGPDDYNYYRRDMRKSSIHFSKRNFGGGSFMMWGAFTASGTLEIQFTSTKMKSSDYIAVLQCTERNSLHFPTR